MSSATYEIARCDRCRRTVPACNLTLHQARCTGVDVSTRAVERVVRQQSSATPAQQPRTVVDLTGPDSSPQANRAPDPPPFRRQRSAPPAPFPAGAAAASSQGPGLNEWQCPACTFHNTARTPQCIICHLPREAGRDEELVGLRAAMLSPRRPRTAPAQPMGPWTCDRCTMQNGPNSTVCEACEGLRPGVGGVGDLDDLDEDGWGMVYAGGAHGGGGGAMAPTEERLTYGNVTRMLGSALNGALLGGSAVGAHAMLTGAPPNVARRRMLHGMLAGAGVGGLYGAMMDDDAIDRMSYEDLLNLFGSGNEAPKADERAVSSLPETTIGEIDLTRMRRDSNADGKHCSICFEDYQAGEKCKRLPCTHVFHTACIDKWLIECADRCPICKHSCQPQRTPRRSG